MFGKCIITNCKAVNDIMYSYYLGNRTTTNEYHPYYWKVKASTANGMTDWKQDSFMTEPDIVSGIFESLYCLQTTTHTCAQF